MRKKTAKNCAKQFLNVEIAQRHPCARQRRALGNKFGRALFQMWRHQPYLLYMILFINQGKICRVIEYIEFS
jgi:hypothetical protein